MQKNYEIKRRIVADEFGHDRALVELRDDKRQNSSIISE